jgi:tetratricopeptide (TPR) repeat protein
MAIRFRHALAPLLLAALLLVAAPAIAGPAARPFDDPAARDRELADLYERIGDLYERTPIDYAAILKHYERIAAVAPGTDDAKAAIAETYHLHKDRRQWPAALATLDRLERLYGDGETIEVGYEPTRLRAVILAERGLYFRDVARDLERARARFEQLAARFPDATVTTDGFRGLGPEGFGGRAAPFARLALAEVEARAGRFDAAEAVLFSIIRTFPAERLLLYEGESYFDEAALLTLRRHARQRGAPPPVAAYDRVATESTHEYVRVRARELAADAQLEVASTLPAGDGTGRRLRYEAAVARWRELVDRHPTFTFAFYGETQHHAVAALDRIVELLVRRLGDPVRAVAECDRVVLRHGANADLAAAALFARGGLLAAELRDPAAAAASLRRIIEVYPEALRYPQPAEGGERLADLARAMLDGGLAQAGSRP